jgi:outer membrane protein OmpA-like peptidoglycan-associated protein
VKTYRKQRGFFDLTPKGNIIVAAIVAAIVAGSLYGVQRLRPAGVAASVPNVQGVTDSTGGTPPVQQARVAVAPLPTGTTSSAGGCQWNIIVLPWNANMGLMYAVGGRVTAAKSLMEKAGLKVSLSVSDDYGVMRTAQLKFAEEYKAGNPCPSGGAAFVMIMGDGYSAYAHDIGDQMTKLGQSVEGVAVSGKSYGEDACMLPRKVLANPQLARGMLVGGVLRDGDYNICVAWAKGNGIPINADEHTWNPDAINFLATDSFKQADDNVIAGNVCEDRPVVKNDGKVAKRTGEMKHICQEGTMTWTPGDVNVAKKLGGLAKVASSANYGNQMGDLIIGNRDFMAKNEQQMVKFLKAVFAGSDQVRSSDDALLFAGGVSAKVYNEQNAQYWAKYYKGVTEKDKQGFPVELGGSRVMNAADNAYYFGIGGGEDVYQTVYKMFGDHYVEYYPKVMGSYPKYETAINLKYLRAAIEDAGVTAEASEEKPVFTAGRKIERIVSTGNYVIEFDTGKATIRPESIPTLQQILSGAVNSTMAIDIKGHTDSTGSSEKNIVLSFERADSVKKYLREHAPQSFDANRVTASGLGQSRPIADNSTPEGRARNRRVEIVQGEVAR